MTKRRSKDELEVQAGRRVQVRKVRSDGWTEARKEAFLAALAETCNVERSLREIGKSKSSYYQLRARDGAFRARIRETIAAAHLDLTLFALEKTMSGVTKTTTRADGAVSRVHEYPLGIAVRLLRLHKDSAIEDEAEADAPEELVDETVKKLLRKIEAVAAREEAARTGGAEGGGDGAGSDSPSPLPSPREGRGGGGDSPSPRPSPQEGRGGGGDGPSRRPSPRDRSGGGEDGR